MAKSFVRRFAISGRSGVVVAGTIAVVLTAGCGTSGPSASGLSTSSTSTSSVATSSVPTSTVATTSVAVAGVDACSLVTPSEASAVIKETVSRATDSTAALCDYVGQSNNTTVEVTVRSTTAADFAARCANSTPFPGIGDAACGAPKAFLLRKGTTEVDFVATTTLGALQVMMNFSTLAKTVATRL